MPTNMRFIDTDRSRFLRRLAEALALAFRIPLHEDRLVIWLGNGGEQDNRSALLHWVERELTAWETEHGDNLLPMLVERLERRLSALEDSLWN